MINALYRLKCNIKFRIAIIFKRNLILEDNKRHCGKTYLINKLSKKYHLNVISGTSYNVNNQWKKWIGIHYDIILLDTYFNNKEQYNLIRRNIDNLNSYNNIVIGFNTYCGNNKWIGY